MPNNIRKILRELKKGLQKIYGEKLKAVILFGSYARGDATEDSDLDLMVIEQELPNKFSEMVRLRQELRPLRIPVDVLVYSQDYVDEWGHLPGTALYWALHEGKVLHEVRA